MNAYFAALKENPSGVRTLADLIAFDDANPDLEKPPRYTDHSLYIIFVPSQVHTLTHVVLDSYRLKPLPDAAQLSSKRWP